MHLWLRNINTSWLSISIRLFCEWLENYVTIGTLFLTVPQLFVTHLELCLLKFGPASSGNCLEMHPFCFPPTLSGLESTFI